MDSGYNLADRTLVRSIMQTDLVTVTPTTPVRELVRLLADRGIGGAPVIDGAGELVGIVSATDLVRLAAGAAEPSLDDLLNMLLPAGLETGGEGFAAFLAGDGWGDADSLAPTASAPASPSPPTYEEYQVRDIMRTAPHALEPTQTLRTLAQLFMRERIHRAPVVEDGKLVGIVTTFDVMRTLANAA